MDKKWTFDIEQEELYETESKWVRFAREFVEGDHKTARIDCSGSNVMSARSCINREVKKYTGVKIATVSRGDYLYVKRV